MNKNKVIVTKDMFGCCVWKEGTQLVYMKSFSSRTEWSGRSGPKTWLLKHKWPFGHRVYRAKKVAKLFPHVVRQMKEGQKFEGVLLKFSGGRVSINLVPN